MDGRDGRDIRDGCDGLAPPRQVRQGKIDNALFDLLEANLQQAQAAGEQGAGAAAVLEKLKGRVRDELDKKLAPPVALIRQLMRMESSEVWVVRG